MIGGDEQDDGEQCLQRVRELGDVCFNGGHCEWTLRPDGESNLRDMKLVRWFSIHTTFTKGKQSRRGMLDFGGSDESAL